MPDKRHTHLQSLDSLRGIAALIVVLYHWRVSNALTTSAFIQGGYLFVDFFFVLSGYVMYHSYGQMRGHADLRDFLIRRLARLYPLHLATFLAFCLLYVLHHLMFLAGVTDGSPIQAADTRTIFGNLTLTHALGIGALPAFNGPSWSISAEFYTYLIFAAAVMIFHGRAGTLAFLALLLGSWLVLWMVAQLRLGLVGPATLDLGIFRCMASFFAGVLLRKYLLGPLLRAGWQATLLELLTLSLIVFCVSHAKGGVEQQSVSATWEFLACLSFIAAIAVFAHPGGIIGRWLTRSPTLLWAGARSYSIYMVHALLVFIGYGLGRRLANTDSPTTWVHWRRYLQLEEVTSWVLTAMLLIVLLLCSELSFRYVELPGQKLGRRLVRYFGEAPAKSATEAIR